MLLAFAFTPGWVFSALIVACLIALFLWALKYIWPQMPETPYRILVVLCVIVFFAYCISGNVLPPLR